MEKIRVKNYRSIADSGDIEICPLTVVVGRNSAGKSSFIRLFPLLKQTLERKISDTLLWYGDYVDFGDYQNTVSKSNADKPIDISFSIMTADRYMGRLARRRINKGFVINVELSIREKYIERVILSFYDQNIELCISEKGSATIKINDDVRPFQIKKMWTMKETGNIIPAILEEMDNSSERYLSRFLNVSEIVNYCIGYIAAESDERLNYNSSYYELNFEIGSKEKILEQLRKKNHKKFSNMSIHHKRFQKINNYIIAANINDILERVNTAVSTDMKQTSYLKPIRAMVNRFYRVQGISIDELDADGSNLPMILKNMSKEELYEFEKWSKEKFGVVFSVKSGEGHISLIIKNEVCGDVETNVADTGYGYSQMLPIVMLLWMIHKKGDFARYEKQRTVVIEQPELHLHPAYQAKMIDVFVNIIKEAKEKGVTVKIIFETHSEAMINRIGKLLSENKLEAKDVNVLIFNKEDEETSVESKRFNEEGLLIGWPIGFFDTEGE